MRPTNKMRPKKNQDDENPTFETHIMWSNTIYICSLQPLQVTEMIVYLHKIKNDYFITNLGLDEINFGLKVGRLN